MKNEYIIGGLAIVGAIALFAYLKPKRKTNSEGFYGFNGLRRMDSFAQASQSGCAYCRNSEGSVYHTGRNRQCNSNDVCLNRYE
jgi:hypothetical protein